jgi:5-methylcytosine-specific restriction endonuclease McrA
VHSELLRKKFQLLIAQGLSRNARKTLKLQDRLISQPHYIAPKRSWKTPVILEERYPQLEAEIRSQDGDLCTWCSQEIPQGKARLSPLFHEHRGEITAEDTVLTCLSCERVRTVHRSPGGWFQLCRASQLQPQRRRLINRLLALRNEYADNPDRVHYIKKELRKIRSPFNKAVNPYFEEIFERDGSECVWCGKDLVQHRREASLEHLIPRSYSGPKLEKNANNHLAACGTCNNERQNIPPGDWVRHCKKHGKAVNTQRICQALTRLVEDGVSLAQEELAHPAFETQYS